MQFLEHVSLAPYTTFKLGGPARWFAEAASESDILEAVEFARLRDLPLFPLGGGSNLLVADAGFPGLVLHIALKGIEQREESFTVAAGEKWDGFVSHVVERDFAGTECLAGIPGTVGGTPIQNVGAYGQEVSETVVSVRALNLGTLKFEEFANAACGFSYRRSIFNSTERGKYIVTSVVYRLTPNGQPKIAYADLKRHFQDCDPPSLREVSDAVRAIRRGKGMYIVAGDPDCR
ncbi:MAG TPA: FAD-binding protein, partial [Acidobacteriaceae bacterium]|nr:FAD-binding protein [Acidobacteriaceae bacterium]